MVWPYGYLPGDYLREGFLTEKGNWWIGNQPLVPYYGYNPPTSNGYYPPYLGYGMIPGATGNNIYLSNFGQIVPAPPLDSPPALYSDVYPTGDSTAARDSDNTSRHRDRA